MMSGVACFAPAMAQSSSPHPLSTQQVLSSTQSLSKTAQLQLLKAAEIGDLRPIQSYVNFVEKFMAITPGVPAGSKVNLDFRDRAGNNLLMRAAKTPRNQNMMNYLLSKGIDVNATNKAGESALTIAYSAGNQDAARFLLARGALQETPPTEPASDMVSMASILSDLEPAGRGSYQASLVADTQAGMVGSVAISGALVGGAVAGLAGAAGSSTGGSSGSGSGSGSGGGGSLGTSGTPGVTIDCGAGLGIHPENCSTASLDTLESQAQEGIGDMNVLHALARGYDGRIYNRNSDGSLVDEGADGAVMVAVIDSGVDLDHPDLDSNLHAGLSRTCTSTAGCVTGGDDSDGHGTNVAGIIAAERTNDGTGMHGVAPRANLIAISAIGIANGSVTRAYQYINDINPATTNVQIVNNSYALSRFGVTLPVVDATTIVGGSAVSALTPTELRTRLTISDGGTTLLEELRTAVAADRLLVFSAGNDALTQPSLYAGLPVYFQGATAPAGISQADYDIVNPDHYDFSNHWVSSISLNDAGTISSFSHRCGVSRNWCLASPGEIATTTAMGGGYEANNGTSFSAPNVSGALAVMLGAFPQLTPERVLEILFDTATDLGAVGTDDIYGRGLVNLQAATDPTDGGWTFMSAGKAAPIGGVGSGVGGGELTNEQTETLTVAATAAYSVESSGLGLSAPFGNALTQTSARLMFVDGYGKDYVLPMSSVSRPMSSPNNEYQSLVRFANSPYQHRYTLESGIEVGFSDGAEERPGEPSLPEHSRFFAQSPIPMSDQKLSLALHYNNDMAAHGSALDPLNMLISGNYHNPYLRMNQSANASEMRYGWQNTAISTMVYQSSFKDEYDYRYGADKSLAGFYNTLSWSPDSKQSFVELSYGMMKEENSLLGSESSGAFGIDASTTYHMGIAGSYKLTDSLAIKGHYGRGVTKVMPADYSFFTEFEDITTESFALGLEQSDLLVPRDRLGIAFSQPLRVTSGQANMLLPLDVALDGSTLFAPSTLNLAPTARELDMEMYYHLLDEDNSQLSFGGMLRMNPNNDNVAPDEGLFFIKYRMAF